MRFELYKDAAGQWRWRLKSANGNIIATSSEGYVGKSDARRGIEIVQSSAAVPVVEV